MRHSVVYLQQTVAGHRDDIYGRLLLTLQDVAIRAVELRETEQPGTDLIKLATEDELASWDEKCERLSAAEEAQHQQFLVETRNRARAASALQQDVIDGLKSLQDRLGQNMTNFEVNAIQAAIAKLQS